MVFGNLVVTDVNPLIPDGFMMSSKQNNVKLVLLRFNSYAGHHTNNQPHDCLILSSGQAIFTSK